ncbi:TrkA family potassium uptake protein [Caldibacillus thermolactis]|uniref:TrkA family potassium uptake protein n=1 Tax=Pallidibacillus thermolactis TaxID=251051 RepID=A0ABT2WG92_9BACI|nr:TrkA family potassium uptake protein [Pallidibacillus thermolactis]MCU9594708.1 TrkA family potassium uptake protein [Pallidibacillus thermolactis]MCU9600413.1 TrkA family potassium uptake protein [Pallidibacillus thermolactis subsp. kokeshiiformis]MED1672141.1 TrkA family potassium uptake protein [Pallidibacillus thermolactis subsp. kokeshiiformis]
MKRKEFVVIGLGRFGGSICRELTNLGMSVLAIDKKEEVVNDYSEIVTEAVVADTTDESVLKNLGIRNFDHVIVAIGDDIQSSILTTLILKEIGVKKVTAKALNEHHEKVLKKIGADQIVHPERDMGRRLAHNLVSSNVLDYLELSDKHSLVEIAVNQSFAGKTIIELDVRARYGLNIVAIRRNHDMIVSPQASEVILEGDILVVIGSNQDITRFERKMLQEED